MLVGALLNCWCNFWYLLDLFMNFAMNCIKHSTNSKKNEELCKKIFIKLKESGHISQKIISQFYDDKENDR